MYCVATGRYACHNKYYGRSLDDSGFRSAIVEYLTGGGGGELRLEDLKSNLKILTPDWTTSRSLLSTFFVNLPPKGHGRHIGCTVTAYDCNRIYSGFE